MKVTIREHDVLIEGDDATPELKAALAKEIESRRDKIEQEIWETMFFGSAPQRAKQ